MNNNSNSIIPLYYQVRDNIYQCWQQLKIYSSKLRTANTRTDVRVYQQHFNNAFLRFFDEVDDTAKLNKLSDDDKKKLLYYYNNTNKITKKNATELTRLCRKLIYLLGITKIEYKERDPGKAFSET